MDNKYQQVSKALKDLQDALNNSGEDFDVDVHKIRATRIGDNSDRYVYTVLATVTNRVECSG